MVDLNKAMLDPPGVFPHPEAVLREQTLSRKQKVAILRRWEYDARSLAVAEEENMAGGPPDMLDDILTALNRLDEGHAAQRTSPTKQGGS